MRKQIVRTLFLAAMLAGVAVLAIPTATAQQQNQVTGRELSTEQERLQYQERMRAAGSEAERQQIRQEHHERMQKRAMEQGAVMPSQPPAKRMVPGKGAGGGMSGKGMSGGKGRN